MQEASAVVFCEKFGCEGRTVIGRDGKIKGTFVI